MTSNEIRGFRWEALNDANVGLLQEIAAQLAELNENSKPRFINFTYKGRPFVIKYSDISSIGSNESGRSYVAVCGRPFTCDQTIEQIAALIGIEVPRA